MAKLILCAHSEAGTTAGRLLKAIRERFPEIEQDRHDDVESLHRRLRVPSYNKEKEIVIALADNSERLDRLIELKECLEGRRLVLVLHEDGRETLSRSHLLRPRYVSCEKAQFSHLLSVLRKMINASEKLEPDGNRKKTMARKTE